MLAYLARNRDRPVSSAELLEVVWHISIGKGGTIAQVKNCIKRLRQKIEPDVKHPRYVQSRRGWGYI
ncbi:MAG: winged helix-turn-helix domain-containing protein [Anaerolineae bacterium]